MHPIGIMNGDFRIRGGIYFSHMPESKPDLYLKTSQLLKPSFIFLFVLCIATSNLVSGQSTGLSDLQLVKEKATEVPPRTKASKPGFGLIGKSFLSRYNPFSLILSSALFGYQKIMSGQISSNCPYEVSCSNFAKSSLSRFGLIKGTALAIDRVTRCNKLSSADFHPIRINAAGKIEDNPSNYTFGH